MINTVIQIVFILAFKFVESFVSRFTSVTFYIFTVSNYDFISHVGQAIHYLHGAGANVEQPICKILHCCQQWLNVQPVPGWKTNEKPMILMMMMSA